MRQRVFIARAFAVDAKILLCDEPYSALDEMTEPGLRAECAQVVKSNDKTAVFITHSIDEALAIGDRVVVLKRPATVEIDFVFDGTESEGDKEDIRDRIRML